MLTELFTRMQYEPSVLMLGTNYKDLDLSVLNYSWNAIVTTNAELKLSALLNNDRRSVIDVFDKNDMQANLMDRRKLHVIRLLGENYSEKEVDDLEAEDIKDHAVSMLGRVSEIINYNGIVLLEDFEEILFSHKEMRKAFIGLYENQKQVYIFNCKNPDKYLLSLKSKGIAVLFEKSINDFFGEYIHEDDDIDIDETDRSVSLYIEAGKQSAVTKLERKQLVETESFATLLNIELLNNIKIPSNMYKDYFYLFLKNSIREPQWFGYSYGFNIHREYEERLYKIVKRGLENVGKTDNKPALVVGQTGTGKSISLAAIAYKVFNEKNYPVIYINDPDVNFYSNLEYKYKGVNKKGSPAFSALDILLEKLENLGAKAILLVWDTSSYSTGREKSYRLYQALLARGRKIYLVSSAYEVNENLNAFNIDDEYDEDSFMNRKFVECRANVEISTESEQLKSILLNKCHMDQQEVGKMISGYARGDSNYLSMFYRSFEILRGELSQGVYREASANLNVLDSLLLEGYSTSKFTNNAFSEALKKYESELIEAGLILKLDDSGNEEKEEINVAKDDFIKCIAVSSQFKIKMPYDFSLRILGTYNGKIIQVLMRSTFFVITQDYFENYEISIRTPLEAQMYLSANNMMPIDQIDCIVKMIDCMNASNWYGQQREVRFCERLIRIIGPNNAENRRRYKIGYGNIIDALERLRTNKNIWEPFLIAQEITYLREYYGRDEALDIFDRIKILEKAIEIADESLKVIEKSGVSVGTRNAIIVESSNSKLLLCQLKESNDALMFKEIRRDLREVIRYDSMNYYAYVTLLKGSITEYRNECDPVKKIELLESMCSVADELVFENPDVASSEYFQRQVTIIYTCLDDADVLNNYVEELVANGSAAGLYVIARKILSENSVDFNNAISNKMQENACEKVYSMFKDERYKAVLDDSESCQYMFLNVVWLMNNKQPINSQGECWLTQMRNETWKEILSICNNYIGRFCGNSDNIHQMARNIRYIKALCLGQLEQYSESLATLREIDEDSSLGIRRVFTKHILCDENGVPKKFIGRLGKYDEVQRNGDVYIKEFGRNPIYYFGPHFKTSDFSDGKVFDDIEIGYSNIAPKAFRDVENKE